MPELPAAGLEGSPHRLDVIPVPDAWLVPERPDVAWDRKVAVLLEDFRRRRDLGEAGVIGKRLISGENALLMFGLSQPVAKALLHDAQQRAIEILGRTRDLEDFTLNAIGETSALRNAVREMIRMRDAGLV